MIFADGRHVHGADAVLLHPHARIIEAADDRRLAPGAKVLPVTPGRVNSVSPSVAPGVRNFPCLQERHGREGVGDNRAPDSQRMLA